VVVDVENFFLETFLQSPVPVYYYVNAVSGSDTGTCSQSNPCRTITFLFSAISGESLLNIRVMDTTSFSSEKIEVEEVKFVFG
jgi:hypothetical protein